MYRRSPVFQLTTNNSYESDIFISDCSDLNRLKVTAICGLCYQTWQVNKTLRCNPTEQNEEMMKEHSLTHVLR